MRDQLWILCIAACSLCQGSIAQETCVASSILCVNSQPPSRISIDHLYVADESGYLAKMTDSANRTAEYIQLNGLGLYETFGGGGRQAISLSPAMIAASLMDLRGGRLFLPLALRSPLFKETGGSAPSYTFLYRDPELRQSSDGKVLVDQEGFLLWLPDGTCIAGRIYAQYTPNGAWSGLEYAIPGGRSAIQDLPTAQDSLRMLQSALILHDGSLAQRWALSPSSTPSTAQQTLTSP